MGKKKKIYVVIAFGGEYDDKWDNELRAYTDKKSADKFINEMIELDELISDEEYHEIEDYLNNIRGEIFLKYYDDSCKLLPGKTDDDYQNEIDLFETKTMYKEIKKKFGYTREEYDNKMENMDYEFVGYYIKEIYLYGL